MKLESLKVIKTKGYANENITVFTVGRVKEKFVTILK